MSSVESSEPSGPSNESDPWAPPDAGASQAPAPPAGWSAPPPPTPVQGTNGFAIASLITGLLCCLWPFALAFGVTGLVQTRRRRQPGKGLAIAGVVLGGLGLCGSVVGLVGLMLVGTKVEGTVRADQLSTGDCFVKAGKLLPTRYRVVPCRQPHFAEVVGTAGLGDGAFPGGGAAERMSAMICRPLATRYAADPWALPSGVRSSFLYPTSQIQWDRDPHSVVCLLRDQGGSSQGSLRLDRATLTDDQAVYLDATRNLDGTLPSGSPAQNPAQWRSWAQSRTYGIGAARSALQARTWSIGDTRAISALEAALESELSFYLQVLPEGLSPQELSTRIAAAQAHSSLDQQKAVRKLLSLQTKPQ